MRKTYEHAADAQARRRHLGNLLVTLTGKGVLDHGTPPTTWFADLQESLDGPAPDDAWDERLAIALLNSAERSKDDQSI